MSSHTFGGYYARDTHDEGLGDNYARDGGWSGGGRADDYARDVHPPRMSFRGRGPIGWPSDERLCELVCEVLTDDDDIDASDIEVAAHAGEVTLEGTVGTRREKRLAEDVILGCPGVRDVHNRLRARGAAGSQPAVH